jgi:hypothetical protein
VLKCLVADQYLSGGDLNLVVQARVTEASDDRTLLGLDLSVANSPRLHYRCTATLASGSPISVTSTAQPLLRSAEGGGRSDALAEGRGSLSLGTNVANGNAYGGVLFHGPAFQVLQDASPTENGQTVDVMISGVLDKRWPAEDWVADPAALDGALQLALLWTEQELGVRSLPTSIETVSLVQPPKPGVYQASLQGRSTTTKKATCDVVLRDTDGNVVAELRGIETHALPPLSSDKSPGQYSINH